MEMSLALSCHSSRFIVRTRIAQQISPNADPSASRGLEMGKKLNGSVADAFVFGPLGPNHLAPTTDWRKGYEPSSHKSHEMQMPHEQGLRKSWMHETT